MEFALIVIAPFALLGVWLLVSFLKAKRRYREFCQVYLAGGYEGRLPTFQEFVDLEQLTKPTRR